MENYKEKYEQALENIKKIKATNKDNKKLVDFIEYKYPELKESEDERIRKWIYNLVSNQKKIAENFLSKENVTVTEKALAWLEKQGEKKPEFCHHEVDFSDCSKEYRKAYYDGWNNCNQQHAQLKAEQKPTDKVEPKFKVGDFIINEYGFIMQIDGIDDNTYVYHVLDDNRILKHDITKTDKSCHLWTIRDAKDGDLLATDNCGICIFDGTVEEGKYPFAYCGVTKHGFEFCDGKPPFTHANVHPATKEQRDLLFQKMKEAGYEWDTEKKELRKIEQKLEIKDDVLSRFAFYQYDDDTLYLSSVFVKEYNRKHGYGTKILKAAEDVAKTFRVSKIRLKVERNTWMEEWYKKNGYEYLSSEGKYDWLENNVIDIKPDKIEQKPDEDNCKISDCVEKVDMTEYNKGFECGKQRVLKYPQDFNLCEKSTSAWSEEDEKMIKEAIRIIAEPGSFFKGTELTGKVVSWLKSLKEKMKGE